MNDPAQDILSTPTQVGQLEDIPGASQRAEFLRLLPKLRDIAGRDRNFAVSFASSLPGEGTTTVAAQFAIAAAQSGAGDRIALIDGHLEGAMLHELLGVDHSPGVFEVCNEGVPLRQAMQGTELENLDLLTAGRIESSSGYLNSLRFREIVTELSNEYDLVVLDCPPLASGHSSTHLPKEEAMTVLVVEASSTNREVIDATRHELVLMGANVIGVVLNKRRFFIPSFVYRRL
ncbi:MAG: CpsD/CapB family tyrosine-protein kinase [Planctomycetes bacterium]|nr:CpsD/CapB family tyrosine-protein kinase [Planctomycetota bacterium]